MKKYSLSLLVGAVFLFVAIQTPAQKQLSPDTVIQKVADKLATAKLLGYKYAFEFSVPSQDRKIEVQADAFLDLQPTGGTEFRFQFSGADRSSVYNGTERFFLDKKGKKLYLENKPSFESFGDMFLQNSPLSLKYALPKIIADKTIPKKVSIVSADGRDQYLIEFSLYKGIINSAGEIIAIRPDHTNLYKLRVDKTTLLPVEVVQANDKNDELLKTTYSDLTQKPVLPTDLSWYFSTYQNEYTLQKKDKLTLIETGKTAPDFSLDGFASAAKTSLDQYKGKLVLVEFWIAQCGFCIAAVPKLNDISQRYRDKGMEMVSINMYDPAATIEFFKKKNRPEYSILTGGDSIAALYGVEAYPAIALIGKDGKVAYSSLGLFEKELENAILANLEK